MLAGVFEDVGWEDRGVLKGGRSINMRGMRDSGEGGRGRGMEWKREREWRIGNHTIPQMTRQMTHFGRCVCLE